MTTVLLYVYERHQRENHFCQRAGRKHELCCSFRNSQVSILCCRSAEVSISFLLGKQSESSYCRDSVPWWNNATLQGQISINATPPHTVRSDTRIFSEEMLV